MFENRYTQYTMETLRVGWEQLVTSVNRFAIPDILLFYALNMKHFAKTHQ